jgi:GMP synthase (glutamine-hydrolysing)
MAHLLVIQHVPHERLGSFEGCLTEAGCRLSTVAIAESGAEAPTLRGIDGLIVMGGPQSVYDLDRHPWMASELALVREALHKGLPILGVCLGAQMLASALGAKVTKNPQKEIGWYPVMREPGADGDPLFEAFGSTETVFQWHGDAFALPKGAVRLASSPLCREQAFRYRDSVYGLQFHVEVTEPIIRAWMRTPVNRAELAVLQGVIDPMAIRRQTPQHVGRLHELSRHVASTFCRLLTNLMDSPHG